MPEHYCLRKQVMGYEGCPFDYRDDCDQEINNKDQEE
jgi:hypothetical protein